ncbi:hypothetical protein G6034_18600 [Arthrobacter sp. AETb3-4]|uniref:Uncharacterized protein n=1 Tax=Arthrobacter wenxiniae TaxID=2713570 RepID=A0A7Y7LZT8_9MICC|nr:hypothetical protein [Arthrobacter wenxiniae]
MDRESVAGAVDGLLPVLRMVSAVVFHGYFPFRQREVRSGDVTAMP